MTIATEYWKGTGRMSNDVETLENSDTRQDEQSMQFVGVSPVKTFPLLDEDEDYTAERVVFGGRCTELCRSTDHDGSSLKIHLPLHREDWRKFSIALPRRGMMQSGKLYQRNNSEKCIDVKDYLLLPTPTASDATFDGVAIHPEKWIVDHRDLPRKLNATHDATWSPTLGNFTTIMIFQSLIPQLSESLMGFPIGWTECESAETPLSWTLRNGSVDE